MSNFKKFYHDKFEKMEITIDFNGKLGHLWDVILIILHEIVTETFTDILKHYFLPTNIVKFSKCML